MSVNTIRCVLFMFSAIRRYTYKQNKKDVSERRDKTYLRNELKLTFRYILSRDFELHLYYIFCASQSNLFMSVTFNSKL